LADAGARSSGDAPAELAGAPGVAAGAGVGCDVVSAVVDGREHPASVRMRTAATGVRRVFTLSKVEVGDNRLTVQVVHHRLSRQPLERRRFSRTSSFTV
jgi:hypothetical protein